MDTMAICPAGGLMTDKIRWDLFVQTGHRQRTEWASPSDGKDKKIYTSQNNNTVKKGSVQRSHMGSQFIHSEKNDILSPKEGRIQSVCVCPFFDDKTKETKTTAKPILSVGLI